MIPAKTTTNRLVLADRQQESDLDAVLAEAITHRPAVDSSKSRNITERDPLAFVEGDYSGNTLVFMVLEVLMHEFTQGTALAPEHTSLDSTLDEEEMTRTTVTSP